MGLSLQLKMHLSDISMLRFADYRLHFNPISIWVAKHDIQTQVLFFTRLNDTFVVMVTDGPRLLLTLLFWGEETVARFEAASETHATLMWLNIGKKKNPCRSHPSCQCRLGFLGKMLSASSVCNAFP